MDEEQDLTQTNPENQEVVENQNEAYQSAEQAIDWEAESNPYRKRYTDSQSQITPLVQTLSNFAEYNHQTKTWEPKRSSKPAVENEEADPFAEYDPSFREKLDGYVLRKANSIFDQRQEKTQAQTEYNSKVENSRSRALNEFGNDFELAKDGKFNPASPLYKLANDILATEYAQFNPDGSLHSYTHPDAEYLATVRAYGVISKQMSKPAPNKAKFNAIQGQGSKAGGVKRALSYEEYEKLSEDEKNVYYLQQVS
jgi:hypothetical protein